MLRLSENRIQPASGLGPLRTLERSPSPAVAGKRTGEVVGKRPLLRALPAAPTSVFPWAGKVATLRWEMTLRVPACLPFPAGAECPVGGGVHLSCT